VDDDSMDRMEAAVEMSVHFCTVEKNLAAELTDSFEGVSGRRPGRQRNNWHRRSMALPRLVIPRSPGEPPPASWYSRRSRSEAVPWSCPARGAPPVSGSATAAAFPTFASGVPRAECATRTSSAPGMHSGAPVLAAFETTPAVTSADERRP